MKIMLELNKEEDDTSKKITLETNDLGWQDIIKDFANMLNVAGWVIPPGEFQPEADFVWNSDLERERLEREVEEEEEQALLTMPSEAKGRGSRKKKGKRAKRV